MQNLLILWVVFGSFFTGCKEKPYSQKTSEELITELKDKNWAVRTRSVKELGERRLKSVFVVMEITKLLKDKNQEVRYRAVEAIWKIAGKDRKIIPAKKIISALLIVLGDKSDNIREIAMMAIIKIGPNVRIIPSLKKALKDKHNMVKAYAAIALGLIGSKAKSAIPALKEAFKDKDSYVWPEVALAIGQISPHSDIALIALNKAIQCPTDEIRKTATQLFRNIGSKAIPTLIENLKTEKKWWVRESTIEALGNIGSKAKKALPVLRQALKDKNKRVRKIAKWAIKEISNPKK